MNKKIDKKQIRKKAKELINQGISKQESYDQLVKEYKYRIPIAEIVRYTPSIARKKKFMFWNTIYLVFLILSALVMLLRPNFGIIWIVLLIVMVAQQKFKYYYWNTLYGVVSALTLIGLAFFDGITGEGESYMILLLVFLPFGVIPIIGGSYLPRLLTPKFVERKEKYMNSAGNSKIRVIHLFEE